MRIATSTMTNMATTSTSGAYSRYYDILNKIVQNKNFTKPSEDIAGTSNLLKVNDGIAKLDEYQSNINTAMGEMNFAYDTLGSVNDELGEISSLITEASNATTTPDSAKAIASELKQRVDSVKNYMNSKYLDNYVFSGTNTETPAYKTQDDGTVVYQGSSSSAQGRSLTIAEGKTMEYNITADSVFPITTTTNPDGTTTTEDFFSKMDELYNTLNQDPLDYDAIRKNMDVLQNAQNKVVMAQGEFSARVSKLDTSKSLNETALTNLQEKKSDIEEVDITKAATELSSAKAALQASYLVSQQVLSGMSLLDYL